MAWPGPQKWFSWRRRMQMQGSLFRLVWIAPISARLRLKQTSMHTHLDMIVASLLLAPHRAAGKPQDAVGRDFFLAHNTTTCHITGRTGQATPLIQVLAVPTRVIGTAIGSKVHGQDGLCWSHPRLVSPSELQCGEAKVAVRPSRRPSQLCSAATERYLDQRRGTRDQRREPAKATARSRLHPMPMRGTWTLSDPRQSTRPPANLHAHGLRRPRPRLRIMI